MPDDNYTGPELAAKLRVSADTISLWSRTGRIPCRRFTRKTIRYSLSEVLAALGADQPTQTPDGPQLAASA